MSPLTKWYGWKFCENKRIEVINYKTSGITQNIITGIVNLFIWIPILL